MANHSHWQSRSTLAAALGTIAGAAAPLVISAPAAAQTTFSDVSFGYWARPFIQGLATENVIAGFPDNTFRPEQPVTRAQFAALVNQAFSRETIRSARDFSDVPSGYWGQEAIQNAYRSGFLSGYPDGTFRPNQPITRTEAIVSLINGLNLRSSGSIDDTLNTYRDEDQIPSYARDELAAATQSNVVVNYPDVDFFNPLQPVTRANVSGFVYQTLVSQNKLPQLSSSLDTTNYIVGYAATGTDTTGGTDGDTTANANLQVSSGTPIDVKYPGTNAQGFNIVVAPGQTVATSLEVSAPVKNSQGQTLIPAGSTIQGRIEPVTIQGSNTTAARFVGERLTIGNNTYTINAVSNLVAATQSQNVSSQTLQGALITAAAQSILGSRGGGSLSDIIGQVIAGTGGTTSQQAVIVVDPDQLDLTVNESFTVQSAP